MKPHNIDLSRLSIQLQQELIDFYQTLLEKQAKTPEQAAKTGFGMLKSKRTAIPADFDPASLLEP